MNPFTTTKATPPETARSVRGIMALAMLALLPGVLTSVVFFGVGVLLQVISAVVFALALEAAMLVLRGKPLQPFISDLSAPLTAVLFALWMPPLAPWWLAAIGMTAAIVIGKHLYGGLGNNLFNPAMVGVAVVMVCFPHESSQLPSPGLELGYATPGLLESAKAIFIGTAPSPPGAQATDALASIAPLGQAPAAIQPLPIFATMASEGWPWLAISYALGGVFLLWKKTIRWQTPAALILATMAFSLPLWLFDPIRNATPIAQLASGSLMLVAFFIATDPVSGCTTPRGRWIFGAGIAFFMLAIRQWGAYPEGVAFAVLLMNCAAPYIDATNQPGRAGSRPND